MGGSAWAQGRIATVELRKVFDGYWKTKQADAALKDRAADIEKDHKNMLDDWKKAKDEYQTLLGDANNQTLSFEEREKRKKSAEDKLKQIKESEEAISSTSARRALPWKNSASACATASLRKSAQP